MTKASTSMKLCTLIRLIPHLEFDERAAADLIEAISGRIKASDFAKTDFAINTVEYLKDASIVLQNAWDDRQDELVRSYEEHERDVRAEWADFADSHFGVTP